MAILRVRDENGNIQEIAVIKGDPGKDAENGVLYIEQELTESQ